MKNKETLSLLINPFVRIAGEKALFVGLIVFAITIIVAHSGNIIFDGIINSHISNNESLLWSFFVATVALIIFVIVLYLTGCLLTKSSIRFIDVARTVTLARAPFILVSLIVLVPGMYDCNMQVRENLLTRTVLEISVYQWFIFCLFLLVSLIASIWFVVLSYRAFSVSCNVRGAKAVISFIGAFLFSETVAVIVIYLLSKKTLFL